MKVDELANTIVERAGSASRHLVAIAGPPGAGKTTLAGQLRAALHASGEKANTVAMDGFHLDNGLLEQRGLLSRKGAPETFDVEGFISLVQRLGENRQDVLVPVFDRDRELAIAAAQCISTTDRFVLVEGNYLLLDQLPWSGLLPHWHSRVFMNPGMDELKSRLIRRWLDQGFSDEKALEKAQGNDLPNAEYVLADSDVSDAILLS